MAVVAQTETINWRSSQTKRHSNENNRDMYLTIEDLTIQLDPSLFGVRILTRA